jgi:hypothetical protein
MSPSPSARLLIVVALLILVYIGWRGLRREPTVTPPQTNRIGDARLYPPPGSPGSSNNSVSEANIHETICVTGYTATVRPPVNFTNRLKREMIRDNSLPGRPSDYELDHIIPLELGGCADCRMNLWMEPLAPPGAHEKDRVENYLHREVCSDRVSLATAQKMIADDWYAVYLQLSH